jgi:hypothetical protein
VSTATLKLWDVDKALATAANSSSTTAASPPPLRVHKVFSNKYPESEVTALAVHDPSSSSGSGGSAAASHSSTAAASGGPALLIAVGLAAGSVYLFSTDTAGPKGKLHHTGRLNARPKGDELWKVSMVAFTKQHSKGGSGGGGGSNRTGASATAAAADAAGAGSRSKGHQQSQQQQQQAEPCWLYVVTESQTLCFNMADLSPTILDQQGSSCGACSVVRDGLLLVARDDALYEYTTDTRAGCTAFDGKCGPRVLVVAHASSNQLCSRGVRG